MSPKGAASGGELSASAILEGIREVLRAMDVSGTIDEGTHIRRDLDLDSMRRIELAIEAENRFRVVLEPEDEEEIETIGDLVRVIRRRLEGRGGAATDNAPAVDTADNGTPDRDSRVGPDG